MYIKISMSLRPSTHYVCDVRLACTQGKLLTYILNVSIRLNGPTVGTSVSFHPVYICLLQQQQKKKKGKNGTTPYAILYNGI